MMERVSASGHFCVRRPNMFNIEIDKDTARGKSGDLLLIYKDMANRFILKSLEAEW